MRNLIRRVLDAFKSPSTTGVTPSGKGGKKTASTTARPGRAAASELRGGFAVEYSPSLDGDPDPGEVVWGWVPYEDDPSQGKDRPMVIIGRAGAHLVGVPLTSKQKQNEAQVAVGTGPWDREGRGSYAKVERLLDVDPAGVRREGAVLAKGHFDDVVDGVRRHHRG